MRRLSSLLVVIVLGALLAPAGCGQTLDVPDLGLVPPGCRLPSKCFSTACPCNRANTDGGITGDCLICDPATAPTQQCTCTDPGLSCVEPRQLCVGRGPGCPGASARCIDPTTNGGCAAMGGDPPTMVAVDSGDGGPPSSQPRCAFADDVCCPGSAPDGGADLAVPDLGTLPDLLLPTG